MLSLRIILAVVAAACLVQLVTSQQYSSRGNYVDEGSFDYAEPAPPQRPASRPAPSSFSRPSQSLSASGPRPTPIPILKQINRHNEDGSYTYGYEGADGAFKIETKLPNGEVMGKYGYVDDSGKVRVVEYGANRYGFQPAGEGITVAPPTLVDETTSKNQKGQLPLRDEPRFDDGQYYDEQPERAPVRPPPPPPPRPAPRPRPQPQYSQDSFQSSFQSQPSFSAPPRSSSPIGPAPPRAQIAGAVPVGGPSLSAFASRPAPSPPQRPSRPQSFFQPSPAAAPAPVYESRPAPPPPAPSRSSYGRQGGGGGILDQLERDFALPSNSAPALHDIRFSSY